MLALGIFGVVCPLTAKTNGLNKSLWDAKVKRKELVRKKLNDEGYVYHTKLRLIKLDLICRSQIERSCLYRRYIGIEKKLPFLKAM